MKYKELEKQFIRDIDTSINLLELLKSGNIKGDYGDINRTRVKRIRLVVYEILNKY